MATTLGTLLIELKAKTDAFERGMKSAKDLSFTTTSDIVSSIGRIGSSLTKLRFNNLDQMGRSLGMVGGIAAATGAALATSIIAVAIKTADEMDAMGKSAQKAGMNIREFTEFAYAAKRADIPIEEFTASMSKLAKTAVAAAQGNAQAQRAFQLAGTSATDSGGRLRSTGSILEDVIKKFDNLQDKTLKVALAQQLFGKGGAALIPLLNQGSAEVKKLREQAELLGIAFGEDTLNQAAKFHDSIEELQAASRGLALQFSAGVIPALNDVFGALTKVEGKASAMRSFGDTVGEVFKTIAKGAYAAYIGIQQLYAALVTSPKNTFEKMPTWQKMIPGLALGKMIFSTDPEAKKTVNDLQKQYDDFVLKLNAGNPNAGAGKDKAAGSNVSSPDKLNYATEEIAKLREKAQGTLALAAAQLQGEASARATAAASQADAIILQIATKASKEHKTALDAEILSAQKKYGASVLGLVTINAEAERAEAFNKSLAEQTREADIAADAHYNLAQAILQGGSAVTEANINNQIDSLVRKANITLTDDQRVALQKLVDAKRAETDAISQEGYSSEVKNLTNAAEATRMLYLVTGRGVEADIQARAAIQAKNYEIQHNITLTEQQRNELTRLYAEQDRSHRNQNVASGLISQYDPQANYHARLEEINAAVAENKDLTVYTEAAKRDAYREKQEAIDALAMKTQRGAAGATVALRQWLRESQNWAIQFHGAVTNVLQGFDTGFRNAFHDVIMGTKSVGEAFAEMGRTMIGSVVDALGQIVAKWIETKIILATLKLFGINAEEQDPKAKAQKQIQANVMEAQSYAGLAAAEEFAYALAQSMGNVGYAAGMSALAFGIGTTYATLAAFDNGGIQKKTGLALVHQDEGVLTAPVTKMLKTMATSPTFKNPAPRGGGASRMGGGDVHVPVTIYAIDTNDFKDKLSEVESHIHGIVRSGQRSGALMSA